MWWTVVAGVCVGLAAGLLIVQFVPERYRASVMMEATGAPPLGLRAAATDPEILARTIERAGRSARPVESAEAEVLRLGAAVSTGAPTASDGQALRVRAGDPEEAARLARTLGQVLAASGSSFSPVAAAAVRIERISPSALTVLAWGLVVGLVVCVGPLLIRSAANPVINDVHRMRDLIPVSVLLGIPRLDTSETRAASRQQRILNLSLSMLSVLLLVAVAIWLKVV